MKAYPIVTGLARVCEYMYRKGVADAASYGDIDEVERIANRPDGFTTLRFMTEEDGQYLPFNHYRDYIVIYASIVRAMELRNFMIYQKGMEAMKNNLCTISDYVYRRGLLDGARIGKNDAIEYFKSIDKGTSHERLDGTKPSTIEWIEEIKHLCNKIYNKQRRDGLSSGIGKLSDFIGQTILCNKMIKERVTKY